MNYPPPPIGEQVDVYHGEAVADPYRVLEDADAAATVEWVRAENRLTEAYLDGVPSRGEIADQLRGLWDYPKLGVPFERGGRWFQLRNSGVQDQPVLFVADSPTGDGRPLLDPNGLSGAGPRAVTSLDVSHDGTMLAYATSDAGSDWRTWRVRMVEGGEDLPDVVRWSKFSGVSWRRDGSGFYYGAMDPPTTGQEFHEQSRALRVSFHRLGTDQDTDEVVFERPAQPEWLPHGAVTDDDRYLVVTIQRGTWPGQQLEVLDLEHPEAGFRSLVEGFKDKAAVVGNDGPTFWVLTDRAAPKQRIVRVDLDHPEPTRWVDIVPEAADTLVGAHHFGGKLVAEYLQDAQLRLRVFGLDGTPEPDVAVPDHMALVAGTAERRGIEGRPGSDQVYFGLTSFTESGSLWTHDLVDNRTERLRPSGAALDPDRFLTEQVFATSDDGTRIPVFLTHRKDVTPDADRAVLLYAYGGFDVATTPSFSVPWAVWLERGGVLAVANLRGGGEYGRAWHDAGRRANKQNVFDDFCACARWLVDAGWSRPERIGIHGRSNGGLLVGACLTQHPELFGAAVPAVGVLDMLRFHKFTIGWAWTSDYGDPDIPEEYRWVRAYSPLHNIRAGTSYPATLILTGDHDDRVVPGHSLKFAAALQAAQQGDAPILLRVDTAAGHGMGKPTTKLIDEAIDMLTFLDAQLFAAASLST